MASDLETVGYGLCYTRLYPGLERRNAEAARLGPCPPLHEVLGTKHSTGGQVEVDDDDEFGPFSFNITGTQVTLDFDLAQAADCAIVEYRNNLGDHVLHVTRRVDHEDLFVTVSRLWEEGKLGLPCGVRLSDIIRDADDVVGESKLFAEEVFRETTSVAADAWQNYERLGDILEERQARRGFEHVSRSHFSKIISGAVARWAPEHIARAASVVAANAVYSKDRWDPKCFEVVMEADMDDEARQSALLDMGGLLMRRTVERNWAEWRWRRTLAPWRATLFGPIKDLAACFGVDEDRVDTLAEKASLQLGQTFASSVALVKASGFTAVKIMLQASAGIAVSASLVVAAGMILDWYYGDETQQALGPSRITLGPDQREAYFSGFAVRAYPIAAAVSDEAYTVQEKTSQIRVDPFFYMIRSEVNMLKDDTAAARLMSNALVAPLVNTVTNNAGNHVLLVPGSISSESVQHIQRQLPNFHLRVVNRNHSHAALWTVRRAFELMVAQRLVAEKTPYTVLVGGSNRQAAKMPGVKVNYQPELTGRDAARRRLCGTPAQRAFSARVRCNERFKKGGMSHAGAVAVAFYSTQDLSKRDFAITCISKGIMRAYVAVNLPVQMMDHRITQYDDPIMAVRFRRTGDKLAMTDLDQPVAGYVNSFEKTMSWIKPIEPIPGYHVTYEAIASVSSSYLIELQIGRGAQEGFEVIWKMLDAGHYVIENLSCEDDEPAFYSVPAQKFDQVVKFLCQLPNNKSVLDASAGRILGLEAAVKIGGVTLERSWVQSHQEFMSTAVHAILAMGLAKTDGMNMMVRLKELFMMYSPGGLDWLRGWCKAFGWYKDPRLTKQAKRARNDYKPVTHWTCVQQPGWSCGLVLGDTYSSDDDTPSAPIEDSSSDEVAPDTPPTSDGSDSSGEENDVNKVSLWRQFVPASKPERSKMPDLADGVTACVEVTGLDVARLVTERPLNIAAPLFPRFVSTEASVSDQNFSKMFSSREELRAWHGQIPCPDSGQAELIEYCVDQWGFDSTSLEESNLPIEYHPEPGTDRMTAVRNEFFDRTPRNQTVRKPCLLIDGISGAAKSSMVAQYIKSSGRNAVIVSPTRKLAKDWRQRRVGLSVTRHGLNPLKLATRTLLIVDEVFCYDKEEISAYLRIAAVCELAVIFLGDRMQQYSDGTELTPTDLQHVVDRTLRVLVSNTMPVDALKLAQAVAVHDDFSVMFQTRSKIVKSIMLADAGSGVFDTIAAYLDQEKKQRKEDRLPLSELMICKDRADVELGWPQADGDFGFSIEHTDLNLSISRSQGLRTKSMVLMLSSKTRTERWLGEQTGLLYVALSRHSSECLVGCNVSELREALPINTVPWVGVNGLMTNQRTDEHHHRPLRVFEVECEPQGNDKQDVVHMMKQRGMLTQQGRFVSHGDIVDNWRPWPANKTMTFELASRAFKDATDKLNCATVPYAYTRAAQVPVFQEAMGLKSVRRPWPRPPDQLITAYPGLHRVAVPQSSADEVLDLKNVVERTARPRSVPNEPLFVETHGERLFRAVLRCFFNEDEVCTPLSVGPMMFDWIKTRSPDFLRKFVTSDPYGLTSQSVRSNGFLKTQVKVKLDPAFSMEENYGQTVLASPPDFNALFGPYSKMLLRNIRLTTRPGVILDTGYSDRDVAREWRRLGVLPTLVDENHQMDVSRQDTSHTPVTLRVFCKLIKFWGLPEPLVDLYELHSTKYEYSSLATQLYKGEAKGNLGSGDPFTLIRNIIQVCTVAVERFNNDDLAQSAVIIKGDDWLSNKIPRRIAETVPEIRETRLKEAFNAPPYHAGRFFLPDCIIPDPLRMIAKTVVKPVKTLERYQELQTAFYDRYVAVSYQNEQLLRHWMIEAYADFGSDFPGAALDTYMALHDRRMFPEMFENWSEHDVGLYTLSKDGGCANFALKIWLCDSPQYDEVTIGQHFDLSSLRELCARLQVPFYHVLGKPGDFVRQGIWATETHAWVTVDLIKFKFATTAGWIE